MADKNPGAGALTNNSLIAAVLAATGAVYLAREAPLEKARPEAYETALHSQGYHDIEARAWQDPFAAVEAHRQADEHGREACKDKPSNKHCGQLKQEIKDSPGSAILTVMVPGASFNEDIEVRRRIRYAVVAGLNREGYAPDDPQRLDYFRLPTDGATNVLADFPYEWFRHREDGDRVLVLWVNEDSGLLNDGKTNQPLLALRKLFDTLLEEQTAAPRRIALLGPWQSDTLRKLRLNRCDFPGVARFPFTFYAYGASIPEVNLQLSRKCTFPELTWTISSDDVVAEGLVEELARRGLFDQSPPVAFLAEKLRLPTKKAAVALLSDWDTLYGWELAKTVETQIKAQAQKRKLELSVERFSYLRGLDGSLTPNRQKDSGASDQKRSDNPSAGKGASDKQIDTRAFERPYGPSQADYLRRLADDLTSKSRDYDFRAIGVLGNDVYDKLWVLRALKPAFPNAVFFTTDYDAALTQTNDLPFTRNLVVATSFGGGLRKERQADIPPLRSAYQTSAFFATQLALEDARGLPGGGAPDPKEPQIFEVTRTGHMMELAATKFTSQKPGSGSAGDQACATDVRKCKPVTEPVSLPEMPERVGWIASVGLIAAAAWLYGVARKRDEDVKPLACAHPFHGFLYLLAVLSLGAAIIILARNPLVFWLTRHGIGEPMALAEGVSIWPVVALRLLLTIFCIFLTWRACRVFRRNLIDIEEEFFEQETPAPPKSDEKDWRRLLDPFLAYRIDALVRAPDAANVSDGWKEYVSQGRWELRLGRCVLWSSIAVLLFALAGGFEDSPPARSYLARFSYNFTLTANFLSASILTLFIFDATALCVSFVEGLGRNQTQWPPETQRRFKVWLGLETGPEDGRAGEAAPPETAPQQSEADKSVADTGASVEAKAKRKEDKEGTFGLLDYWIDVIFIAKHTSCVNTLVYYPFLVIALSILAHSAVFAAYPGSKLIAIAEGIGLFMVFCCALVLRWAAERARRSAEHHFARELIKVGEKPAEKGKWGRKQLETLLERVQTLDGGAFSPLLEQPFIKALLLPLGSIGLSAFQGWPWLSGL